MYLIIGFPLCCCTSVEPVFPKKTKNKKKGLDLYPLTNCM